jgi:hypothetical protein
MARHCHAPLPEVAVLLHRHPPSVGGPARDCAVGGVPLRQPERRCLTRRSATHRRPASSGRAPRLTVGPPSAGGARPSGRSAASSRRWRRPAESSENAPATFDAACDLLAAQPDMQEGLAALRTDLYGDDAPGQRGRPAAKVGDVRAYKVQQVGETDPFIRLPVSLLGLAKGATASVTFADGKIIVTV